MKNPTGGDLGAETAQERRLDLFRLPPDERWHINQPGGRDICADCWEAGVR